jgi:hypothetical protein
MTLEMTVLHIATGARWAVTVEVPRAATGLPRRDWTVLSMVEAPSSGQRIHTPQRATQLRMRQARSRPRDREGAESGAA